MAALRLLPILFLVLVCVSSAPTTKDKPKAKDDSQGQGLTLLLEDAMFDDNDETTARDQQQETDESQISDEMTDTDEEGDDPDRGEDEEEDDDSTYSSEFDSFPSWYLDQLMTMDGNDSEPSNLDEYQKYKDELNQLILDVKLYQVYHSIKTLKSVLDDLLDDQRKEIEGTNLEELNEEEKDEEVAEKDEAWEKLALDDPEEEKDYEDKEGVKDSEGQSVKVLTDRQIVIAKQLGSLKNQHRPSQDRSSRRIKRDLSFGDDDGGPDVGELSWNDGKPDLRWLVKYDNDDYGLPGERNFDEENGFEMTKDQIQDLLSTFFPTDGVTSLPSGNEVNINVGDQSLSQQIWYPSKRGFHRGGMDRNYFSRLPTLEGMKKRRRTFIPIRRSGKSILDPYDVTATQHDRERLTRNQIAKLARRLAQNTNRRNGAVPMIKEFTNGPAGDVNLWFENNPMYNIGVDDNIGDTYGLMEVDLPRTSPDEAARFQQARYNPYIWGHVPRLERRSHIVEEPSLPGPYQGYFMEGQLWHDILTKRSASTTLKPKNLKIGGPNAWGNFIFISDKGLLPNDGEWFSQSFGDNIGNNEAGGPTAIETEGMWDDGDDDEVTEDEKPDMNKQEEEWIKRLFGLID